MTTTGIKAGNIPNQESVTLASSVSYKNKKSDNGLYSLPSNVHPTSGDITHNNYYDVNGDGIMDPELACMYSVNAGYFLQDYNIVLTGIK